MHVVSAPRLRIHDSKLQPNKGHRAPAGLRIGDSVEARGALRAVARALLELTAYRSLERSRSPSVANSPLTCQF